eukprot:COSAG03_NODE_160_length_11366_cov_10.057518_7_plen_190_part_00
MQTAATRYTHLQSRHAQSRTHDHTECGSGRRDAPDRKSTAHPRQPIETGTYQSNMPTLPLANLIVNDGSGKCKCAAETRRGRGGHATTFVYSTRATGKLFGTRPAQPNPWHRRVYKCAAETRRGRGGHATTFVYSTRATGKLFGTRPAQPNRRVDTSCSHHRNRAHQAVKCEMDRLRLHQRRPTDKRGS